MPRSSSTSTPSASGSLSLRRWSASKACSTSPSPSGSSGASVLTRRDTERHERRRRPVAEARGQRPTRQGEGAPRACPASEGTEVPRHRSVKVGRRPAVPSRGLLARPTRSTTVVREAPVADRR
jgi:hypothetical protein